MKSATRLIPTLTQPLRSNARPISRTILSKAILAGPSRLPRFYATTSNAPTATSTIDPNARSTGTEEGQEGGEEELPSNIHFEELSEEADERINDFLGQHDEFTSLPNGARSDPILLPITSLNSPTPTLASESDMLISLPPDIFAQPIRRDILHRCVVWYLSLLRSGTKTTKSRSTVNYSGRKLRPQKGTGRARVGDASSGTRRGGAPIHPIFAKDWSQKLPRKVRALGLKIALTSKLNSGLLRVVQDLNEGEWTGTNEAKRALSDAVIQVEKPVDQVEMEPITPLGENQTQDQAEVKNENEGDEGGLEIIDRFGPPKDLSILFIYSPSETQEKAEGLANFARNIANLTNVELMSVEEVEVYHILKYKWLVMDGESVDFLSGLNDLRDELDVFPEQIEEEVGERIGA
ncbi:mitochondrial 54S ribosomal protein uL4m [Kwoniella dejecticola CBS 10117]|uniref:Large ribosomal subunit protein uL4m n=1 Tax=Kwoniella dejecticola CBS 10117 TaxID=1296121 RepID=A0A1A6A7A8_9TREE|nr:50S ribosomal protein L4 [Kwoniella dejecticola CBS 10117]OBR85942.1 50S ribosomal protein L4 [Kwoniella dejecticola CBS 10117]